MTIPQGVRREIDRQESQEHYLVFLTITHPELGTPLRVVSDTVDHIWGGVTYIGFPFQINLLSDTESAPFAELRIQNVTSQIGETLLLLTGAPMCDATVIAGSEFDQTLTPHTEIGVAEIVRRMSQLRLRNTQGDAMEVSGRLETFDFSQEVFALWATKDRLPGLFR